MANCCLDLENGTNFIDDQFNQSFNIHYGIVNSTKKIITSLNRV